MIKVLDDGMAAIDEIISETEAAGKTPRRRGASVASASEVYPGAPWMVDPVVSPVPNENTICVPNATKLSRIAIFFIGLAFGTIAYTGLRPCAGPWYWGRIDGQSGLGAAKTIA